MIKLPKIGNKRTSSRRKGLSSSKHHKFKLPKVKLPKISKKSKEASKEVTKGKSQGNVPFFKKIRNIRIVRGITLFIVFSIAAMLIVGVTGYIKLGNISSNSKKIYSENLVPIVTLGDLRSNIANMCSDVTKIVYNGYSAEAETEINGCDSRIRDLINQYKIQVKTMESTEKDAITRLENDYSGYMNAWNLVKSKVESGQKVTEDEEKAFNTISNNMTTGIDGMISYKKSISEKLQKDNQSLSSSSLTIMSITIAAAVILLLFLSIFLISVIKGSMKEIIKDIDLVAEGDLTVNIDTSSSNEFGIMKKELDKTVKKISGMINLIKESAASLGEQSEALAEVSEEMTAFSGDSKFGSSGSFRFQYPG
jgi:methyl-accepting chemotaxis protein